MFMTKEDFMLLQQKQQESGLNLTAYLKQESLPYSNYHYWKRKFSDESGHSYANGVMVPISVRNSLSHVNKLNCIHLVNSQRLETDLIILHNISHINFNFFPCG